MNFCQFGPQIGYGFSLLRSIRVLETNRQNKYLIISVNIHIFLHFHAPTPHQNWIRSERGETELSSRLENNRRRGGGGWKGDGEGEPIYRLW